MTYPILDASRSARSRSTILMATLAGAAALTMLPATGHATEEPSYAVLRTFPEFEIRQYAAYTVAEVLVAPPASDAGVGSPGTELEFAL